MSTEKLNLYLITQNMVGGYDTFDSAIVAANSIDSAKTIHPSGRAESWIGWSGDWCRTPKDVDATYIGEADSSIKFGLVLASFNAA